MRYTNTYIIRSAAVVRISSTTSSLYIYIKNVYIYNNLYLYYYYYYFSHFPAVASRCSVARIYILQHINTAAVVSLRSVIIFLLLLLYTRHIYIYTHTLIPISLSVYMYTYIYIYTRECI